MKAETKKLTAEERQQMETFMQKVRQKDITVIEAAQTILRNRDSYAQNQVNAYKDGLRKEIDALHQKNFPMAPAGGNNYIAVTREQLLESLGL